MINKIFVTGTDTDIGKTFVTLGLSLLTQNEGLKTGVIKPFQSGAEVENSNDLNEVDMNLGLIEFQPLELDNWIKSIELIMNKVIKLTHECIKINFLWICIDFLE